MAKDHLVDYDTAAANNTDADGVDVAEGTAPSNINDAIREIMADLAEFYQDVGGGISSGGADGAYTLTTNDSLAAYVQGQIYAFEANHAMPSTVTATLNINAIGAKPIRKNVSMNLAAGDIKAKQIILVAYENTDDVFQMMGPVGGSDSLESGTMMVFYQDSAPSGWTIFAAVDEHALTFTKGSAAGGQAGGATGGTHDFSAVFANLAEGASPGIGNHTLTGAQSGVPGHTHPNHNHSVLTSWTGGTGQSHNRIPFTVQTGTGNTPVYTSGDGTTLGYPWVENSTTTANSAASAAEGHAHTVDLRVKWAACIVATKD